MPPLLLVSVTDPLEAKLAFEAGADWVDVKQPARGSLGMADPTVISQVVGQLADRCPVSVALGELVDWSPCGGAGEFSMAGIDRAKVGLAGCATEGQWRPEMRQRWIRFWEQLPSTARSVAVLYADWQECNAPAPEALFSAAATIGCSTLLVDTCQKSHGSLLDHWPPERLTDLVAEAHCRGMTCVVAGSLRAEMLPAVAETGADVIAVRGAACQGSQRTAKLCPDRIAELRQSLMLPSV